jgi:hypothetical protein
MRNNRGKRRARLLAAAALVGCVAVAGPVGAQPPEAQTTADTNAQAEVLFNAGVQALDANRLDEARAFFQAALRLKQHWQIASNLGHVELSLGKSRDAAEHLDLALRTAKDAISAQDRQRTQDLLAKAQTSVGTLTIQVDVPGAEVLVDGKPIGTAPLAGPVYVEPGTRKVEARREGYTVTEVRREIGPGAAAPVMLRLERLPGDSSSSGATGPGPRATSSDAVNGPRTAIIAAGTITSGLAIGAGTVAAVLAIRESNKNNLDPNKPISDEFMPYNNFAMLALVSGGAVGLATCIYALTGSSSAKKSDADKSVGVHLAGPSIKLKAVW